MRVPKRRPFTGDVVSPEDANDAADALYRGVYSVGEHNLNSADFKSQVSRTADMDPGVAWRVAHAYRGALADVNECLGGSPSTVAAGLVFRESEVWKTIWEVPWSSEERRDYHAMASVQAGHAVDPLPDSDKDGTRDAGAWRATEAFGVGEEGYLYLDGSGIQLAWVLDGDMPSEHVRGALDTGATGLNMERGFGGLLNAQEVSALFLDVPPGQHTLRLVALRTDMGDNERLTEREVFIPLFEGLVWEVRR